MRSFRRSAISAASSSSRAPWAPTGGSIGSASPTMRGSWKRVARGGCRAHAADEARHRARRQGLGRVHRALRLRRGAQRRADPYRRPARVVGRSARIRLQHAQRQFQDSGRPRPLHEARAGSGQAPGVLSLQALPRRVTSTTATCSARASRSTTSRAT
jgi:hypothetical protein